MRRSSAVALALWMVCGPTPAHGQARASGSFAPLGPPIGEVARVDAGGGCIVDLVQDYRISGTIEGRLRLDYRIFVDGACGAAPGTYEEEWLAHGTLTGIVGSDPVSATLWYRAEVAPGGVVDGRMRLAGDVQGELVVSGLFSDGQLSYEGTLDPS